jgi:soluble lytic murein transglycosylase-like protein
MRHQHVPSTPLRLVVAALCLEALIAIGPAWRTPEAPVAPTVVVDRTAAAREPHWVVKVDGWTLEVDQVHRGYLRDLDAALAALEQEPDPLLVGPKADIPYLDLIARTAVNEGIDWRLVVAIIAVESGFNPTAESDAGAYGLMQVMPIAARDVEMVEFQTPASNVRAGVRYLRRLLSMFPAADPHQQIALALSAYNMGPAHLADAQLLATRYGLNPRRWYDGIELVLPLLEQPAIYRTLPNGFARGRSVRRYVQNVLGRYERLRREFAMAVDEPTRLN